MTNVIPIKSKGSNAKRSNVPHVCVTPRSAPIALRKANPEVRSREHLTPDEVARMVRAASKAGRYGQRDAALVLTMYQHGLRVSEVVSLYRADLDLDCRNKSMHVARVKNGSPATHPVSGSVTRALRPVLVDFPDSRFVFTTERGGPLSASAVRRIIQRAGVLARIMGQEVSGLTFMDHVRFRIAVLRDRLNHFLERHGLREVREVHDKPIVCWSPRAKLYVVAGGILDLMERAHIENMAFDIDAAHTAADYDNMEIEPEPEWGPDDD